MWQHIKAVVFDVEMLTFVVWKFKQGVYAQLGAWEMMKKQSVMFELRTKDK